MTALLTPVQIPKPDFDISYHSEVMFMGSCFADNIGRKMEAQKFQVCHNPFGVVYNPLSLSKQIELLLEKDKFEKVDLDFHNGLWHSYMHYTLFSDQEQSACLAKINTSFLEAKQFIKQAQVLVLTLGTSFVYELNKTGEIVSNCHKLPSAEFSHRFSEPKEIIAKLRTAIEAIRMINPDLQIVFTVSPIRHFKDGAISNQRSKSALILSIRELEKELRNIYYFPAYEIFMDELRDYRFYASDMLHPSDIAIKYIWQRFCETFFTEGTLQILSEIEKLLLALAHKPRNKEGKAHLQFLESLTSKLHQAQAKYPFINFEEEIKAATGNV